jgi:hypothetical protein
MVVQRLHRRVEPRTGMGLQWVSRTSYARHKFHAVFRSYVSSRQMC